MIAADISALRRLAGGIGLVRLMVNTNAAYVGIEAFLSKVERTFRQAEFVSVFMR